MTAFDALMAGAAGSSGSSSGGARPGSTGDWRQAVEQAQANAWLRDRNLTPGAAPAPGSAGESAIPSATRRAGSPFSLNLPASQQSAIVTETALPTPPMPSMPADRTRPTTVQAPSMSMPQTLAVPLLRFASDCPPAAIEPLAAATAQGEVLRARARRQSIHAEGDEQGVSVWIRDTSLNSQEARHLATAIAAAVSSGQQTLAAFYLNGRPMADVPESS